jgi:RHS repeat-associated protein
MALAQFHGLLGSTVSLADSAGSLTTQYIYEPFGATTAVGSADANGSQYSGRENDGTGLYFYRARYYMAETGRFVSEDPLGLGAGQVNLYAYVSNDPVNLTDPMGLTGAGRGCGDSGNRRRIRVPGKRRFFNWLNEPLSAMARDLDTSKLSCSP